MESLIFLIQNQSGKIKARTVANCSTQRAYIHHDDTASPTAANDAIIITGVIEAKQGRDVMINNVPNTFVQTPVPQDEGDEIIIMKIWGALVDILYKKSPEIYEPCVRFDKKNGEKILYCWDNRFPQGRPCRWDNGCDQPGPVVTGEDITWWNR